MIIWQDIKNKRKQKRVILFVVSFIIMSIAVNLVSMAYTISKTKGSYNELGKMVSNAFYENTLIVRKWNAFHGGVYVPVTEDFQPNPYLDVPQRDIYINEELQLTMVNPAYMTRLIGQLSQEEGDIRIKITSLKVTQPLNTPDDWEREALEKFKHKSNAVSDISEIDGEKHIRYIGPLYIQEECLVCHGDDGFKIGDLRGGLSVAIPYAPFEQAIYADNKNTVMVHISFLFVFLALFTLVGKKVIQSEALVHTYTEQMLEKNIALEAATNKVNEQIRKARYFHQFLLQNDLPNTDEYTFASFYEPLEQLGGDYFSVKKINNKLVLYLTDVSGHGIDGAMMTVFIKEVINNYISSNDQINSVLTPTNIIRHLSNQYNKQGYPEDYFICIFLGIIDMDNDIFTYSSLGLQYAPIMVKGDGQEQELTCGGLPLSTAIDITEHDYQDHHMKLESGSAILLTTDGMPDQEANGQIYDKRLKEIFKQQYHLPPQLIVEKVKEDYVSFISQEQPRDDITLLIVQKTDCILQYSLQISSNRSTPGEAVEKIAKVIEPYVFESEMLLMGIYEAIANAVEHGNNFENDKTVSINVRVTQAYLDVTITDEGNGFDWKSKRDASLDARLDLFSERGRGIMIARNCCDYLIFNQQGNKVSVIKLLTKS